MTLGDIATKARDSVEANISNWTDANLLIDINIYLQRVCNWILEAQDDADFDDARNTTYPMKDLAMVALQMDYPIPTTEKLLKLKDVSVTYDGVNYYRATPIDSVEIPAGLAPAAATTHLAYIDSLYSKTAPRYDWKYGSLFVYPRAVAADVALGASIHAEWSRQVTPFLVADYTSVLTDSTVVPGFDDIFHPVLSTGASYEQAKKKNLPTKGDFLRDLADWEVKIKQHYSNKDKDRQYIIGADIGDYGAKGRNYWNLNGYYK